MKKYYFIVYECTRTNWRAKNAGGTFQSEHTIKYQDIIDVHPIQWQLDCNKAYNKQRSSYSDSTVITDDAPTHKERFFLLSWIDISVEEYVEFKGQVG